MSSDENFDSNILKEISKTAKKYITEPLLEKEIVFAGENKDIMEHYFWHLNFPYFVLKGYKALKLEDQHYFSENSQFGGSMRQVKGGAIKAFQENLSQMVQLIKIHLMPLLKELKQAEFYKEWIDKIVISDKKYRKLLEKNIDKNSEEIKKLRKERNEAISHIKDKWVNEVDGGRMWQMNKSSSEQGLDFVLLPQLFFGINLDDPLQKKKTLKEQLDEDIYTIDVTEQAKEQVARFMYRFYTWLPTAINETNITFKIKVAALKQFYAQLEMYANFMKPLLIEINRKNEGLEKENFYHNSDSENPDFVTLFDYSYSFVRIAGIKSFERDGFKPRDLDFDDFGLFIYNIENESGSKKEAISYGPFKGKSGYILNADEDGWYEFLQTDKKIEDEDEFNDLYDKWKEKKTYVHKDELRAFPVMVMDFKNKRRNILKNTNQGLSQVPYMVNTIIYKAYRWNIFEIALYRDYLREESLDLLSTFIGEVDIIKKDLMKYVSNITIKEKTYSKKEKEAKKKRFKAEDSLILGPFVGLASLFSPLMPESFSIRRSKKFKS
jgi:hypothetical protein